MLATSILCAIVGVVFFFRWASSHKDELWTMKSAKTTPDYWISLGFIVIALILMFKALL